MNKGYSRSNNQEGGFVCYFSNLLLRGSDNTLPGCWKKHLYQRPPHARISCLITLSLCWWFGAKCICCNFVTAPTSVRANIQGRHKLLLISIAVCDLLKVAPRKKEHDNSESPQVRSTFGFRMQVIIGAVFWRQFRRYRRKFTAPWYAHCLWLPVARANWADEAFHPYSIKQVLWSNRLADAQATRQEEQKNHRKECFGERADWCAFHTIEGQTEKWLTGGPVEFFHSKVWSERFCRAFVGIAGPPAY